MPPRPTINHFNAGHCGFRAGIWSNRSRETQVESVSLRKSRKALHDTTSCGVELPACVEAGGRAPALGPFPSSRGGGTCTAGL